MSVNIKPLNVSVSGSMTPRDLSVITDLIIHHTAGPITQSVVAINQEHIARGMAMIGYNYVIEADGMIYAGRPLNFVPAAAYGRNTESVNVALTGNFQSDDPGFSGDPTYAQVQSLTRLAVYLHHLLPHIVRTIGHRDVAPFFYPNNEGAYSTACPGNKLYVLIPRIRAAVSAEMAKV